MVFMPMRVNRDDLEEYFRLCRAIDADSLVLRPLLYLWNPKIEADRGGYHFDYAQEMLASDELAEIFHRCDEYSQKYGVPVANQFYFGIIELPGKGRGDKESG
jgi:MoaA/NifB/PqqE/SkfB family radical SAM enzyme